VFRAQAEKEKAELAELFDMTDLMTGAIEQVDLFNNALEEIGGGDKGKGAEKLAKMAEITGVSVGELAAVITGEVNPAVEATIAGLEQQNRVIADNARETNHISDEDKKRQQTNLEILDIHNKQAGQLETNAERAATWKAGLDGVVGTALDLNTAMEKIDANQDNVIDGTDKLAVKAADVDMDGMLSHTELVNAGLLDIITKAGLIPDPGMPNTKRDAQEIRTIVAGLDGKKVNVTMTLKSQQAGAVTQLIGSAHQTQNRAGGPP
jgi:hypothetical protein